MTKPIITLIIIGVTCLLYIIDRLPVALVTVLGMLAMVFSGATTSRTAFSNFGSTPVLLTFGMIMPGFYAPIVLNKFNKKTVGMVACFLMAFFCVTFYFAGEAHASLPVMVVLHFLYGASNCAAITCFVLIGEIVDDAWLRTGIRSDGVMYSMVSFGTKLGNAIGGSIGILGLAAVGFVANTEMSAATLSNMDKVINFGPAAIYVLAGVFYGMLHMTNAKGKENEPKVKAMMEAKGAANA